MIQAKNVRKANRLKQLRKGSAPGVIRTPDLLIRSLRASRPNRLIRLKMQDDKY
jgi:hypothetical protein